MKSLMECPYLELDVFGDICYSGIAEECRNPFNCFAVYDAHGNLLKDKETGLDREIYGF